MGRATAGEAHVNTVHRRYRRLMIVRPEQMMGLGKGDENLFTLILRLR